MATDGHKIESAGPYLYAAHMAATTDTVNYTLHPALTGVEIIIKVAFYVGFDTSTTINTETNVVTYTGKNLFLVCKQWNKALCIAATIGDPPMREIIQSTYLPAIPAPFYNLLSFQQKAMIGNYTVVDGDLVVKKLKTCYRMSWPDIIKHCKTNKEMTRWLLSEVYNNMIDKKSMPPRSEYLKYLYKHFEAYRKYASSPSPPPPSLYAILLAGPVHYHLSDVFGTVLACPVSIIPRGRDIKREIDIEMDTLFGLLSDN